MGNHGGHPVEADPKTLAEAQAMWAAFVKGAQYAGAAIAAILIGLAFAFIKFT